MGHPTVKMPYKYKKDCPICNKSDLQYISDHLRQVHKLYGNERKQWLKRAVFSRRESNSICSMRAIPYQRPLVPPTDKEELAKVNNRKKRPITTNTSTKPTKKLKEARDLVTEPYPSFRFRHKFSLLIVGPSQSGKTHFVQQILENDRIEYKEKKKRRILWCYAQWQDSYETIKKTFKKEISFSQGLPKYSDDLSEIDVNFNNLIILDDLMAEATDSPVVSRLFTQGRHRNASVILLLQNMFPKGKYNTDISRNAQYIALFRSPSDRKQIGIVAERMFDKQRDSFMEAFYKEIEKAFGYLLVDNKPDTSGDKQVIGDVFGQCHVYSNINRTKQKDNQPSTPVNHVNHHHHHQLQSQSRIFWSNAVAHVWQNYTNNAPTLKSIPEGYDITEMHKTSRDPTQPSQPGVIIGGELYWPVKLRHRSSGTV